MYRGGRMNEDSVGSGKKMKISDFQTKDVINIVDGKRLGQISDLELDLRRGLLMPSSYRDIQGSWDCSEAVRI